MGVVIVSPTATQVVLAMQEALRARLEGPLEATLAAQREREGERTAASLASLSPSPSPPRSAGVDSDAALRMVRVGYAPKVLAARTEPLPLNLG